MKRPARVPLQLPEPIHQRLNAYALAAGAAGVGVLAFTHAAVAKIIYTPTHRHIHRNTFYNLDINHDGITDFTLNNRYFTSTEGIHYGEFLATVIRGNFTEGARGLPFALRSGVRVDPPWTYRGVCMVCPKGHAEQGHWINAKNRYLGLKFQINGQYHYGWARLSVETNGQFITAATLTGYAYETIPNKPIITGKTHGKDEATLGRLAQGASGVVQEKK
jgi:hypothetical protein